MYTLVTGVTGFVGGHLAEHLLASGDRVLGCSRRGVWPPHLIHLADRVELMACELAETQDVERLFDRLAVDSVFHLAGLANPRDCQSDPARAQRDNVRATEVLFETARRVRRRPRLLYVSSSYLYGNPGASELPITTDCPIRADHPYAATKWAAEQLSLHYARSFGLDIVRVRPFNHIGPRQPAGYVVSDWAQQICRIEAGELPPFLRVGDLDTRRDYTDVRDVVRAYRMLVCEPSASGVYNLGTGLSRSGREILDVFLRLSRLPLQAELDPTRLRSNEAPDIIADATPLRTLLGWRPEFELETTLRDVLNSWRHMQGDDS